MYMYVREKRVLKGERKLLEGGKIVMKGKKKLPEGEKTLLQGEGIVVLKDDGGAQKVEGKVCLNVEGPRVTVS